MQALMLRHTSLPYANCSAVEARREEKNCHARLDVQGAESLVQQGYTDLVSDPSACMKMESSATTMLVTDFPEHCQAFHFLRTVLMSFESFSILPLR